MGVSEREERERELGDKTYFDWVVSAVFAPSVYFKRAREVAERHPIAVSTACGVGMGIFLGAALVDGQKASEDSLYGYLFKRRDNV